MRVVRAAELGGLLVPPCVRFLFCNFPGRGFEPDGGCCWFGCVKVGVVVSQTRSQGGSDS